MTKAERRIIERMIHDERTSAIFALTNRDRMKHGFRGDAIKELSGHLMQFNQANRRERERKKRERNGSPKFAGLDSPRRPKPNHDLPNGTE